MLDQEVKQRMAPINQLKIAPMDSYYFCFILTVSSSLSLAVDLLVPSSVQLAVESHQLPLTFFRYVVLLFHLVVSLHELVPSFLGAVLGTLSVISSHPL